MGKLDALLEEGERSGVFPLGRACVFVRGHRVWEGGNTPADTVFDLASLTKVMATKEYGATVILHGQSFDDAAAHAQALALEHGYVMVHAFNDYAVMAGQGTAGLELLEALPQLNTVVVPIGGGGLISGMATALKALKPSLRVIGVQAAGCSSILPSLKAGHPVQVSV